jgi:hypothetical protein
MNPELYDRLISSGVAASEAESIVKSIGDQPATEDVDVDALTKAMQDVASSFESPDTVDVDSVVEEATNIVDAVTKGADALLSEQRGQFEALSKGFAVLAEEIQALRAEVARGEDIAKAMMPAAVARPVDEPALRKSVSVIPTPAEAGAGETDHQSLIRKALEELSGTPGQTRQGELRKAVALLESGAPSQLVRADYRL